MDNAEASDVKKGWEMKIDKPIDIDLAVKGLGGDASIFYMMLASFENMTLL